MARNSVFKGSLGFISLPDILQILAGCNSTGRLFIRSSSLPAVGLIFFLNGNPVDAVNGPLRGMDAIYSLFGWTEADFEFCTGKIKMKRVINCSPMQITLDALRMLDDGKIEKIGNPGEEAGEDKGRQLSGETNAFPLLKGPLVDYGYILNEEKFSDGTKFVREGAHGNWIWVILEGTAEVTRETSRGPMTIARVGEGCFVGTLLSFLHGQNSRSATVTAVGDVSLGLLDTQRLSGEFRGLSPDFRTILISLDRRLRKISERAVTLFLKGPDTEDSVEGERLALGYDAPADDLFMITEGETYVVGRTSKGELPLMRLEEKDVIGRLPFMDIDQEYQTELVTSSKHFKVDRLDAELLQREYDQLSGTFRNLICNVGDCVSLTTRLVCSLS